MHVRFGWPIHFLFEIQPTYAWPQLLAKPTCNSQATAQRNRTRQHAACPTCCRPPKAHTIFYTNTAVTAATDKPQVLSAVTAAAAAAWPACCFVLLPPLALLRLLLLLSASAFSTHASISGFTTSGASS